MSRDHEGRRGDLFSARRRLVTATAPIDNARTSLMHASSMSRLFVINRNGKPPLSAHNLVAFERSAEMPTGLMINRAAHSLPVFSLTFAS